MFMIIYDQGKNMQIPFWAGFSIWVAVLCNSAIKPLLLNSKENGRDKDLKRHVGN